MSLFKFSNEKRPTKIVTYIKRHSPQGVSLNFFTDIHQGVGWLGVSERYYFSLQENFRTADPCPGTDFSQLWRGGGIGGKLKGDVRRILDEKVYRKAQGRFSQISG